MAGRVWRNVYCVEALYHKDAQNTPIIYVIIGLGNGLLPVQC